MTEDNLKPPDPKGRERIRWLGAAGVIGVIALALHGMPGREDIPPLVESDYAYQLLAADRLTDGHGMTSLQPVAPGQPWTWNYDWGFVTQWPCGYSLLVAGVRRLAGVSSLSACAWVNSAAVALALVGWFRWLRRCAPAGLCGGLLALAGAVSSVTPALLIDPSTDVLLVAGLPWVMLIGLALSNGVPHKTPTDDIAQADAVAVPTATLLLFGILTGAFCWFRYAAVFLPAAIAAALLVSKVDRWANRLRRASWFGAGAALSIGVLLIVNYLCAPGGELQQQLNLGQSLTLRFDPLWLIEAWMHWTNLGYYDYERWSHRALAALPALLLFASQTPTEFGRRLRRHCAAPAFRFSVLAVIAGLGLILASTALFGDKFNYVELDRYYLPLRPLYFAVIAAPLLAGVSHTREWRSDRGRFSMVVPWLGQGVAIVALVFALSWSVNQGWMRTMARWRDADRPMTPYGQWARCFAPHGPELFGWLRENSSSEMVIVSNYHEFLALETGLPTIPVPPSALILNEWLMHMRQSRNIERTRVVFVLDPENRWRDYWIDKPDEIVRRFDLLPADGAPPGIAHWVFELPGGNMVASSPL